MERGQQKLGLLLQSKNKAEEVNLDLFNLRKTLASLSYYVVLSQRSSLKIPKVDISLSKG